MPVMAVRDVPRVDETPADKRALGSAVAEVSEHADETATTTDAAPVDRPAAARPIAIHVSWRAVACGVWLCGSILWFALATIRLFRFGRLVRRADPAPAHLQAAARQLAERFGLRRCPDVRVVTARIPPLLWWSGRRTVILLPRGLLGQLGIKEQTSLLAHDLAHYGRGDHLVRWGEALILGVYWWHPVVWWARRRLRQAEEQCCDAWVLWAFPGDAKRYAHTLLTAVEFLSAARPAVPAVATGLQQIGSLKRRLEMILNRQVRRRLSWAGAIAVVIAALAVLPWSARTAPAQAHAEEAEPAAPQESPAVTETAAEEAPAKESADEEPAAEETGRVEAPAFPGRITGVVLGPDGSPVSGAQVYLKGRKYPYPLIWSTLPPVALPIEQQDEPWSRPTILQRTRTDAAGRFAMELERLGPEMTSLVVVVVAKGLAVGYRSWEPTAEAMEFRLPKAVPVRGRLLGPEGKPAEDVLVNVMWFAADDRYLSVLPNLAEEDLPEYWPRPVRSDGEGAFTLSVMPPDSRVRLRLSHPELATEEIIVDAALEKGDGRDSDGTVRLPPTFSHQLGPARPVEGVVTAADTGKPLAGVFVKVYAMGRGGGDSINARTDQTGRYHVSGEAGDRYTVAAHPPHDSGYLAGRASREGWPEGEKRLVMNLPLDRGKTVRGRVLDDETGKPIPGASVLYGPSRTNPLRKRPYLFRNPALTDEDGRFTLTAVPGSGHLTVETADRSYLRSPDVDGVFRVYDGERAMPMGLTTIDVPAEGAMADEVVIRLKRGRTVTLQAVGPKGEKLPDVLAAWEGMDALHADVWDLSCRFPEGKVVVSGLDPSRPWRVLLFNKASKLGAVFDITPEIREDSIEVRLQPTGTVLGRCVRKDGTACEDEGGVSLIMSLNPELSEFTSDDYQDWKYGYYNNFTQDWRHGDPPYPDGKFSLEYIVPGMLLGLSYGRSSSLDERGVMTIKPLTPGERRDLGTLNMDVRPPIPGGFVVGERPFTEAVRQGGELKYIQGIPVLFISGDPEQIGSQYAALLVEDLRPLLELPRSIGRHVTDLEWKAAVPIARAMLKRAPERYWRELDAAARGAKLTEKESDLLIMLNGLFEIYEVFNCAAFLVEPERSATGEMLFGRNFDFDNYGCLDRLSLVTVCRPEGRHAFASVGFPGWVGVPSGMNDAGLAVASLGAYGAADDSPEFNPLGTPLYLTFRRILEECSTVEEAEKLLEGGKFATRMILSACDTRRAVVFEITPKNVVVRRAEDHLLASTNSFRSAKLRVSKDSEQYAKLQKYWEQKEPLGRSDVEQAMRDVARSDTLHTMIFEPKTLKLHLAIGAHPPATEKPLVTLDLAELFQHKVAPAAER
jgi:isopenicillin-N N-acyltransferase-like protein